MSVLNRFFSKNAKTEIDGKVNSSRLYKTLYSAPTSTYTAQTEITVDLQDYKVFNVIFYNGSVGSSSRGATLFTRDDITYGSHLAVNGGKVRFIGYNSTTHKLTFENSMSQGIMIMVVIGIV